MLKVKDYVLDEDRDIRQITALDGDSATLATPEKNPIDGSHLPLKPVATAPISKILFLARPR